MTKYSESFRLAVVQPYQQTPDGIPTTTKRAASRLFLTLVLDNGETTGGVAYSFSRVGWHPAKQVEATRWFMSKLIGRTLARGPGMAGHPVKRASMGSGAVAMCAVLMLAYVPAIAVAEPACTGIHVNVLDIRNSTGKVACALFESPEGFPKEFLQFATNIAMLEIRETQARCHFLDIPAGTYALAVIHDENLDGKLATNWLGAPTEGYGFSNKANASLAGAPSFEDASFTYEGQDLEMTLTLNY